MATMTRRELFAALLVIPVIGHIDRTAEAAPKDDGPIWDVEITDCSWRAKAEVMVAAVQRGSIGDTRYDAEGYGHGFFAWPKKTLLAALGPRDLCETLLSREWLEDGEIGTVTVAPGLLA